MEDTAHAPSSTLVPLEEDTARAPSSALQLVCFEDPRSAAAEVQLRRKSTRNSPSTNFYRPPGAFARRACIRCLRRVVLLRVCVCVMFAARMYVKIALSPVSIAQEAFLAGADLGGGPGGRNARHGQRR